MAYFSKMTSGVTDSSKKNAVIMGRQTYDCIPDKYRPLSGRVNIVLTRSVEELKKRVPREVVVVNGLDEAIQHIEGRQDIESTWVIGGSEVYKRSMVHPACDKIYLTEIQKSFECDTFFPSIDHGQFVLVTEDGVPQDLQQEGDTPYYYRIYKKCN
ncbi:dihydrofolate reductase-like isoform X2 [Hyposmocoma kahamanoa]|nr:dihydrofolate reductase-like isoform X2 [Hyposmocoma kahamanoa]